MLFRFQGQPRKTISLCNAFLIVCGSHFNALSILILDKEYDVHVLIERNRSFGAAYKLDGRNCILGIGINFQSKIVSFLLRSIAAESRVSGNMLQCTGNLGLPDNNILL